MTERPGAELWAVYLPGPDTQLAAANRETAENMAIDLNVMIRRNHKADSSHGVPLKKLEARVIKWIGEPEEHARRLAGGL